MEQKRSARMTAIPQLGIPDILVDDEDDHDGGGQPRGPGAGGGNTSSALLRAEDARAHHRSWSGSADLSLHDTNYAHPLSFPPASPASPGHQQSNSAISFELQETGPGSGENSRRGSAVSPAQVRDMLDDSVWVESIRRSATVRRSDWGSYR
jgi:voltage-dependent calcium channel